MAEPSEILALALRRASVDLSQPIIKNPALADKVNSVCRSSNRATTRLLLACSLAKIHNPKVDIRKPYTQIGDADAYSGRHYDEIYLSAFIHEYQLPCNPTTAFLTPALRNRNSTLVPGMALEGRPKVVYDAALDLLSAVHTGEISADELLTATLRCLLVYKNEREQQLEALLDQLHGQADAPLLSAEGIVTLIEQHLKSPRASRLPVLVVAAAYQAAQTNLGEYARPLQAHNAADRQTGALGDIEIALVDDNNVVTIYEMKMKRVTTVDIDNALQKVAAYDGRIDNYIFITTDIITDEVREYAAGIYEQTGGIEMVVLDCIGFLRHFLHLFHRLRMEFLEAYQSLLLAEGESAVRQELKTAFLALRRAAESVE